MKEDFMRKNRIVLAIVIIMGLTACSTIGDFFGIETPQNTSVTAQKEAETQERDRQEYFNRIRSTLETSVSTRPERIMYPINTLRFTVMATNNWNVSDNGRYARVKVSGIVTKIESIADYIFLHIVDDEYPSIGQSFIPLDDSGFSGIVEGDLVNAYVLFVAVDGTLLGVAEWFDLLEHKDATK
jgi:hypothetical protein